MFTVNHVTFPTEAIGSDVRIRAEHLFHADRINAVHDKDGSVKSVYCLIGDMVAAEILEGSVFVMNDAGKTINSYHVEPDIGPE